jgi:hypothetical protein
LVNTVVVPVPADTSLGPIALSPGATVRSFFGVDRDTPFAVHMSSGQDGPTLLGALYAPGGRPALDDDILAMGPGAPADFNVDGEDAQPGTWEVDALGSPIAAGEATVRIESSPVRIGLQRTPKGVELSLVEVAGAPVTVQLGAALIGGERGAVIPGLGSREESLTFTVPAWARELVIDAEMPAVDWSRFTDFAFTLYDTAGHIVIAEPLNFADVRLRLEVPESLAGETLTLRLTPAFADSTDTGVWNMKIRMRLFAEAAFPLEVASDEEHRTLCLEPGAKATVRFAMTDSPWLLPDGFFPLGQGVVMEGDTLWTRTGGLPVPIGPVMR